MCCCWDLPDRPGYDSARHFRPKFLRRDDESCSTCVGMRMSREAGLGRVLRRGNPKGQCHVRLPILLEPPPGLLPVWD